MASASGPASASSGLPTRSASGRPSSRWAAGVGRRHAAFVIEDDHAGGRHVEQAAEEVLLLLQPDALVAQVVHHAVVDLHEQVDVRVPRFEEPRRELALVEQLGALPHDGERGGQARDDEHAPDEGDDEGGLDGDEPEAVALEQVRRRGREQGVHHDEVHDEAAAEIHTAIPYFSNRR